MIGGIHINMEMFIFFFIGIVVLLIGIFIIKRIRKNPQFKQNVVEPVDNHNLTVGKDLSDDFQIQFQMLPLTQQIDETKLVEIKDSKVLARVNHLVPGIFQAGITARNAIHGNSQVFYQAIIPVGTKLTKSQVMAGAVRGLYHSADGIGGHANLIAVNNTANVVTNAAASAMGVASMIVGQYYMEQINVELTTISKGISRIADFQDNEYRSKVFALLTQIKKISSFKAEILENDELRATEISKLNNFEHQCIELLGQANLTIAGYSKKVNLDFDNYEKELPEVHNWYIYQKTLLEVMYRIADLKYVLYLGSVSREQCSALLPIYAKQVKDAVEQLNIWHKSQVEKLGIDVNANLRKRIGLDGFIHKLPGLFDAGHKFRPISETTSDIIVTQISAYEIPNKTETIDLFKEDVRVIAKDGKFYCLPEEDIT